MRQWLRWALDAMDGKKEEEKEEREEKWSNKFQGQGHDLVRWGRGNFMRIFPANSGEALWNHLEVLMRGLLISTYTFK